MSVTFAPAVTNAVATYSFACPTCGADVSDTHYWTVSEAFDLHFTSCEGNPHLRETYEDPDNGVKVNFSNTNVLDIYRLLGLEPTEDLCGSMPAADFIARIQIAQALNIESGARSTVVVGNAVYCGRSEDYYERALSNLLDVAEAARRLNVDVFWG